MRGFGATHLCETALAYRQDGRPARCAVLFLLILEALAEAAHAVPMRAVFWSHGILTRFCKEHHFKLPSRLKCNGLHQRGRGLTFAYWALDATRGKLNRFSK